MLLTLYDQYGNIKTIISPSDNSTQDKEIQGDNLLNLSFTLYEFVNIDVNDYVDYLGERYWAMEKYLPQEKSTVEWEYNIQLYGIESLIKRFLVLNNTDGENEAVFALTARPIDHVRLIVKNINDGMDNTTNFKVGSVEGTENVVIDYTGKYCDEALKELAEAVGVEWWIEGQTVNLCRCEHGVELTLGYDKGLTSLDRDTADNTKFYTRLFPIGSSRNIDPEKYGHSRLQLPDGAKYVDVNADRYGIIHHYEQDAFADIYPRRIGVVSSVRSKEVKDTDGNPFTIYYFKDNDLPFNPDDYMIGGKVLHVSFQEGSELAELGTDDDHYFEVNWHQDTKEFEIITIWPYDDDTQLPGNTLVPKTGDKYILWNCRMPDEYYGLAEKEFRSAVDEYNKKRALDVSRYKAPTDHVWVEESGEDFYIGRRVRLESQEYFPDKGFRSSRITRISRQVTLPSQMDLEISDALSTGTLSKIDDAITDTKNYTKEIVGAMNVPDVIRSWDTTQPTDTNIYSARKTQLEFLNKNRADRAKGALTFEKLLTVLDGIDGQTWIINNEGKARLLSMLIAQAYGIDETGLGRMRKLISDELQGTTYSGENMLTDKGFKIWTDNQGEGRATVDYLNVRKKFTAMVLEYMEKQYSGGDLIMGSAGCKVDKVIAYDSNDEIVPLSGTDCYNWINNDGYGTEGYVRAYVKDKAAAYGWITSYGGEGSKTYGFLSEEARGVLTIRKNVSDDGEVSYEEEETVNATGDVLTVWDGDDEYEYMLTPYGWVNLFRASRQEFLAQIKYFRCYFLAKDGRKTIENKWQRGDQALCQTLNLINGNNGQASNRRYWRTVIGTDVQPKDGSTMSGGKTTGVKLDDGETYHYIDLSNEEHTVVMRNQSLAYECRGYDISGGTESNVAILYGGGRYKQVEYIESNGSQWIDTGVSLTEEGLTSAGKGIGVDIDVEISDNNSIHPSLLRIMDDLSGKKLGQPFIGLYSNKSISYNNTARPVYSHFAGTATTIKAPKEGRWCFKWRASADTMQSTSIDNEGNVFYTYNKANPITITDAAKDLLIADLPQLTFPLFATLVLRHTWSTGATRKDYIGKGNMRLYGCKLYIPKEGTVVRDYIPVIDTMTGDYGLWDKIERKFYGRVAGDNFTAGEIVMKKSIAADIPAAEDSQCQVGHKWQKSRQNMQQLVVTGQNAPAWEMYTGINDFSLEGKWVLIASPTGTKVRTDYLQLWSDANTESGRLITWLGSWNGARTYKRNEGVTWKGSMWVCNKQCSGIEPGTDNDAWEVYVSAGKDGDKGDKGDDGKATNIKGVADGLGDDADDAVNIASLSSKQNGIVLLQDPDKTGIKAMKWTKRMATPTTPNPIPTLVSLVVELNDMYIYNNHAYVWDGNKWDNRGEWHITGADGKDGEMMFLEPSTIVLNQSYEKDDKGNVTKTWRAAATRVRYVKGDTEQTIDSIKVKFVNNEQDLSYPCRYSVLKQEVIIWYPTTVVPTQAVISRAEITAKSGGLEQTMELAIVLNPMGSYYEEIIGDVRREIAHRTVINVDDEGNISGLDDYTRELFSSASEWWQWIHRTESSNVSIGTLVRQTADAWYVGYYAAGSEVTALKIDGRGATFTGDVKSKNNGWKLNYTDGSGYLAGGNIIWDKDGNAKFKGEIEAEKGKFTGEVNATRGLFKNVKWGDVDGVYLEATANGIAVKDSLHAFNNARANVAAEMMSDGQHGGMMSLVSEDGNYSYVYNGGIEVFHSGVYSGKVMTWSGRQINFHLPVAGLRKRILHTTHSVDLNTPANEDYETIICEHNSGTISITLPKNAADGQELTIRVRDSKAKIIFSETDIGKAIKIGGKDATATSLLMPQSDYCAVMLIYNATKKDWEAMFMR